MAKLFSCSEEFTHQLQHRREIITPPPPPRARVSKNACQSGPPPALVIRLNSDEFNNPSEFHYKPFPSVLKNNGTS